MRDVEWQSSSSFHTLLETIATILALMVGAIALLRYYSRKEITLLFIGAGFLGTAFLDGYHMIVTSMYFLPLMPSDLPSLIPWSWVASRQFLAILLFLSLLASFWEHRLGEKGRYTEVAVYSFVAVFAIGSFLFFAFMPIPPAYYPELIFHRPEEFGPALFFLFALIGYLRKGTWRHDAFEHWLVLSLIVGFVGQAVFMSFSDQLFDFEFDAAHTLKKVSYVCVLIGLMISIYVIFRESYNNETRIGTVLETVLDAIITIDEKGTVQSFNPAAEHTFGYSAAEIIGQNVKIIMASHDSGHHDQYLRNYMTMGEAKIIGLGREVVGRRKDGLEMPIELAVTEMYLGNRRMFVGSCRDITQRKRAEQNILNRTRELEVANAELDAFAYSVSHDLRAPLRGMDGFSQALMEDYGDSLGDEAKNYIERISNAARRMGRMIDDILTLSRATRQEMRTEDVDLSALAYEHFSELRARAGEREVVVEVAPDMLVHGDAKLLRVVLDNLINNAWKFTGNNPTAHIEFGCYEDGDETIFFVRDDGAGFDMAYGDKLFGIFQRLHSMTEFEGTGVGLATVARLVGRHGGRVWAEGRVNEGATFFFTLR
ncbi:MAG: PAS domain S-box protein [Rhodospirillaceae bacterium]|nr:PAS domain S-box protein [Rhodospirillaceae bacterium]